MEIVELGAFGGGVVDRPVVGVTGSVSAGSGGECGGGGKGCAYGAGVVDGGALEVDLVDRIGGCVAARRDIIIAK